MYSAYKLNNQGDNMQPWCTPFPIWNQSVVPCLVLTVASWLAYRFLKRQVRWSGIPISFRIFHSILCSTQSKALAQSIRPGKCTKHRACFGQIPCRATWSLSSVDQESISCHERAQTQRGPDAVRTPHTCHGRLFTVFLPPHNTTEQVSLDKWPPLHPCVRAEIRHWRDLQTGSQNKQRGNCSGSNRCNRLKPVVSIN